VQAATKRTLATIIVDERLATNPLFDDVAPTYFPARLPDAVRALAADHPLRHELVAMLVANDIVDRLGPTWVHELTRQTGRHHDEVIMATWLAREVCDAAAFFRDVDTHAGVVVIDTLRRVRSEFRELMGRLTRRYLGMLADGADANTVATRDAAVQAEVREVIAQIGSPRQRRLRYETAGRLIDDLVDERIAMTVGAADELALVGAAAELAERIHATTGLPPDVPVCLDTVLRLTEATGLDRLTDALETVPVTTPWEQRQRVTLEAEAVELALEAVHHGTIRAGNYQHAIGSFRDAAGPSLQVARRMTQGDIASDGMARIDVTLAAFRSAIAAAAAAPVTPAD
jgi:glutamate dehydrogenase